MLSRIAEDGEPAANRYLLQELKDKGVRILTDTHCREIREGYVLCSQDDRDLKLPADQVILAAGRHEQDFLKQTGEEMGIETVCVGDAAGIKNGIQNIWEAFDAALEI